jgi:hypothetical protein
MGLHEFGGPEVVGIATKEEPHARPDDNMHGGARGKRRAHLLATAVYRRRIRIMAFRIRSQTPFFSGGFTLTGFCPRFGGWSILINSWANPSFHPKTRSPQRMYTQVSPASCCIRCIIGVSAVSVLLVYNSEGN